MESLNKKRIIVKSVSKKFYVGHKGSENILARIVDFFSGREQKKELQAVKDVSFDASEGEIVGIIGKNGSGKSTLLRLIAEIYKADVGTITTHGKLMYINGYNHGTRPRLTMRENIFLVGSIMGLSRNEVKAKFDEIVEFSGLQDFVDTKIYQFSSGMTTRLNFSIFINCATKRSPDILLLDEVLGAGGDIDFKNKAESKMQELIKSGATVLFVSHSLKDVEKYCHKVVLLNKGVVEKIGLPDEVIPIYNSGNK